MASGLGMLVVALRSLRYAFILEVVCDEQACGVGFCMVCEKPRRLKWWMIFGCRSGVLKIVEAWRFRLTA